ncbi:MAG: AAA family ATPase, partial [Pantoea sp.]|nr:AAA family ATPase [Pantoea sp.]
MSSCVTETISASRHRWEEILLQLGIDLPGLNKHGPCPCCGGTDRFRFDDKDGRGTWFCNQCGNGDGLDLIAKVKKCNPLQATKFISELSLPCQTAPTREKVSKPCASIEAKRLLNSSRLAKSPYLESKGLSTSVRMLSIQKALTIGGVSFDDDSMILPIHDIDGTLVSAQLINAAGEKRYLPGTRQNGGFIKVGDSSNTANIIIAEGYATALTVNLATGHLTLAAMSANHLLNIAVTARHKYPNSNIIMAAENDSIEANNVGLVQAEKAAVTVNGWVSFPPDQNVSDWDDYRQIHDEAAVNEAFHLQMYKPDSQLSSISRIQERKPDLSTSLPLRKGSDGFDTRQDYLIKGYLPSASVTSAYGASGSYKSFLAVSWGCHIATGKPWAGRPVTQGAVIYVVGEGGIGVPRRIRAWEESLNDG